MKKIINIFLVVVVCIAAFYAYEFLAKYIDENRVLKQVISRLQADSRIAEVLVSKVEFDEETQKNLTTIKFLEYDIDGRAMEPKYFTFAGNIIQFQSLVIRFDDLHVKNKDKLKGRSIYLFWKVFLLDGENTQEYEITKIKEVPSGYRIGNLSSVFERKLWENFWQEALNPDQAKKLGIKNAQIEAPGTMFIPGTIYTIKIEHDGGIRIDARALPGILRGESIPSKY
ncbi:MAG: hypothetical protein NG737_00725 [Omnitrophica bacterium]|nr:hypothetical protein [Candidatus Omnitrophota bacterium]